MTSSIETDSIQPFAGQHIALVGKLGGITRREGQQLIRDAGGLLVDDAPEKADIIVLGADEMLVGEKDELLNPSAQRAVAEGQLEIISETQFFQRLGLVENQQNVRRLYTPAMLAKLLDISVATIRRWHRRKLIVPVREVHRLPYFDFQEIATARRLAQLLAAGASPAAIEKKLGELSRFVPGVERPLAQLSVIVEGKQLLLRQGEGLIEPGGQMRIDFDSIGEADESVSERSSIPATLPMIPAMEEYGAGTPQSPTATPQEMLNLAADLEDEGQLSAAAEVYRATLAAVGPRADINFQLAELLYRLEDLPAARERYYTCIELDEDYVEARANLGCVLAETGELTLAVAAFQGALKYHQEFPDVHYHLARTFDEIGEPAKAKHHWEQFLQRAPDSPWADEAAERLQESAF